MEECGYCKEKENRIKSYEEEIEREKVRECHKALEREKIARGMQSTKEDEMRLREVRKMQMAEKRRLEDEQARIERMWHQVLVDDFTRKEHYERLKFQRKQQEMQERRRAYDEQIASANRKRQEALQQEREKENIRLEMIKKKMEEDRIEELKRKKDQQWRNKENFIEGHRTKMALLYEEREKEKAIDNSCVRRAKEELKREEIFKVGKMQNLRKEKQLCMEYQHHERNMALCLRRETEKAADEFKALQERMADERCASLEAERVINRKKAQEDYQKHLEQMKVETELQRRERVKRMELVNENAIREVKLKLERANDELKEQMAYRDSLNRQMFENHSALEKHLNDMDVKQKPFTRKHEMFKDAMDRIDKSPGRKSTNPVHPFRRALENQSAHLPSI